ncbi:hypothetical protein JXL19_07400 [bacterium]|nr:hypothetical protein [bacterium]
MNKEKIGILHRHWIWADKIKLLLQKEISVADLHEFNEKNFSNLIITPYGIYMFIWYGLLFVVLEGLKQEKIIIPDIDNEIEEIYESLRLFRNAVFHIQNQY